MRYQNIVILTGAGISAESGLKTFRGEDGLWENHRLEEVATPEAFARDPDLVQRFYNARRAQLNTVEPNPAHRALARLQLEHPGNVLLVTQNIDDLHERGGSPSVLHMHGELKKARCQSTGRSVAMESDLSAGAPCSVCGEAGCLRPHVVWFGEIPIGMDAIEVALNQADLFISIGTSGSVYPAAGFVQLARQVGAHTVELNLEPSQGVDLFREHRHGPAGEVVPAYIDELLAASG
ncbi:MAG: Sir2 family NAD+-dependent deacetylase [Pseudomonadota bacterium]